MKAGPFGAGSAARWWAAGALLAAAAWLPFARGVWAGSSFFFRDLSLYFFPLRRFVLEGLLKGEVRYWNPYVYEGVPLSLPPIGYPLDLLQLMAPHEPGLSLLLACHVPLAALTFGALARAMGQPPGAAFAGGCVYALGGFLLSTLNLYVFVQAAAWCPLLLVGMLYAFRGGRREVALCAVFAALALSTTGAELVAQTALVGLVLFGSRRNLRGAASVVSALLLGCGLAAAALVPVFAQLAGSARGGGFATEVVLGHSIHPITFAQVVVAGLYGDLHNVADRWWGANFFPRGFPYLLSLYLGPTVLSLAAAGSACGHPLRRRLVILVVGASVLCLGRWAGLAPLVDAVPALRTFRYPSKAFFTVHLCVAMLSAFGVTALASERGRAWKLFAACASIAGGLLVATRLLPRFVPGVTRWFLAGFFPPDYTWGQRFEAARFMLDDAAAGGGLALFGGFLGLLVLAKRLNHGVAVLGVAALVAVDLLRAGAGLNPMLRPSFFRLPEPMSSVASLLRQEGGRVFTYDVASSRAYTAARAGRGSHEAWSFAALRDTLTPYFNVTAHVPSAYGLDLTMMVPTERVLDPADAAPDSIRSLAPRLRRAGVAHLISTDPVVASELDLRAVLAPPSIEPLVVHLYRLRSPLPLRAVAASVRAASASPPAGSEDPGGDAVVVEGAQRDVTGAKGSVVALDEQAGRIQLSVLADRATVVVVRDAFAPGWRAAVDGTPARVLRADGRHRAVEVPAGRSRVLLTYAPPGLPLGLLLSLVSLAAVGWLWASGGKLG